MIDLDRLLPVMDEGILSIWAKQLPSQIETMMASRPHGDMHRWQDAISQMPDISADSVRLDQPTISVRGDQPLSSVEHHALFNALKALHPWRKGPYEIHGIHIDTEWRSDWKWDRVAPHLAPLEGRTILDVGCGNGYHCWRMAGAGAKLVIGIDPTQLFLAQFAAIQKLLGADYPVHLLPLCIEQVPADLHAFDSVFSMGVLYHRRSPIDHLTELKGCLRPGGELVLETLVVEGDVDRVLVPNGRYAKMRNVWFIPSTDLLALWLTRCGFQDVRLIDVTPTTIEEQRSTEWMQFESLTDYLDPNDSELTIEGYPAPRRATFIAQAS